MLAARKRAYLRFLVDNFRLGLRDIPVTNLTLPYLAGLAVFLFAVRFLVWPQGSPTVDPQEDRSRSYIMQLLIVLGVLFAASGLLLVAVTHMTSGRYLISVALFLPSILVLWIFQEVRLIAAGLRSTYGPGSRQRVD